MASEVLINVAPAETRVAIVEQERLSEIFIERTAQPGEAARAGRSGHRLLGNIMLGRVQRVLPGTCVTIEPRCTPHSCWNPPRGQVSPRVYPESAGSV